MSKKITSLVKFRRKREGLTNYKKRLRLIASGKVRVVIRRYLNNFIIQFIKFHMDGDQILLTVTVKDLKRLGWNYHGGSIPSAYLTGFLAGKKAKQFGINEGVFDKGLQPSVKGSSSYAALKGVIDAGVNVPCSKEVLPQEERIRGEHIAIYAKVLKSNRLIFDKQFSGYSREKVNPEEIMKKFEEIKTKILRGEME